MALTNEQTDLLEILWQLHEVLAFIKGCEKARYDKALKQLQKMLPELDCCIDEDMLRLSKLPPLGSVSKDCIEAALGAIKYGRSLSPELKDDLDKVLSGLEHYINSLTYIMGINDLQSYHQIEATKEFARNNMNCVYYS